LGCKRILLSPKLEYYRTLKQTNVQLVTDAIKGIDASGIITDNEHFEADIIIYATGFEIGKPLYTIQGKSGLACTKITEAFWGITYPNFPNIFTLLGPNTALGHNSVVWMIECQVNYIIECLGFMIQSPIKEMDVKKEKLDHWYDTLVLPNLEKTVWTGSCKSWYKDENGRVFTVWPGFTFSYWWGLIKAQMAFKEDFHLSS